MTENIYFLDYTCDCLYTAGMFIRQTIKTAKGKEYIQHQLIESIRTPQGPRHILVLNLGVISLDKHKWKDLANAIEHELHNQPELFVTDPEIKKLAQHYAKAIIKNRLNQKEEKNTRDTIEKAQYETVDVNSVKSSDVRSVGVEYLTLNQMGEYHLDSILKGLQASEKQIIYAKMLIAGRIAHPASERETVRWINENSAIHELLHSNIKVYDNALHRTAVWLWEHHDKIEQQLSAAARKMFSLKETIILYDLTNTYFEGTKKNSTIAKPSKISKERRNDRPLITLALTIDEEGFPKQSRILEGNISEPKTLERMLDRLTEITDGFNSWKTIVIDAGIATEANLAIISDRCFKYVAVSRKQSYENNFWESADESQVMLSDGACLKVKLKRTEKEAWLLCHSGAKEAKERAILARRFTKFEEGLIAIKEGLKKKGTRKGYNRILERIGRLKEKYKVGSLYHIEIKEECGVVSDITFFRNPNGKAKEESVGEYVLRTNRIELTGEEISNIHRSLTTVEDSFKSMKSDLGLRPNWHQSDDPSVSHIFITVLGYHIISGILKRLRTGEINYSWSTVRNILSNHARVTTTFNTEKGDTMNIRTTTTCTVKQEDIYHALKIKHNPLKRVKIVIPSKRERPTTSERENVVMKKMI